MARKAVVRINTTYFHYSYEHPWESPYIRRSSGTGFLIEGLGIEGNRILTNAHVVSNVNTIRVRRIDQATDYEAELLYIAHDCDLAILKVKNPKFYKDVTPLEIGRLPQLNSSVEVIGFPIGGARISITRGIISRIDMDLYSHSGIDYHLIIQVDAAINPGNSGGPALQNGKVIGVAFQVRPDGENLGYLIPPQVIQRFLADIKDKRYDGYTEFGIISDHTVHLGTKKALGLYGKLSLQDKGILVYDIIPNSSGDGHIQVGDILLKINGKEITDRGEVELEEGLQNYSQLVDNLHVDDLVSVELLRSGKHVQLEFLSKTTEFFHSRRKNYEMPPSYLIAGGLLFQPLDANLIKYYSSYWTSLAHSEIQFRYYSFFSAKIYKEVSEDVVLTRRLADATNSYAEDFLHRLVHKINGTKIKGFKHFQKLLHEALRKESYVIIDFYNVPKSLVIKSEILQKTENKILKKYGIEKSFFIASHFKIK